MRIWVRYSGGIFRYAAQQMPVRLPACLRAVHLPCAPQENTMYDRQSASGEGLAVCAQMRMRRRGGLRANPALRLCTIWVE